MAAGMAQAGVVDFTDGVFTTVASDPASGVPTVFSEEAAGVTFTFALQFQNDPETFITDDGLRFEAQGFPVTGVTISADQDVVLNAFAGIWTNPQVQIPFQPRLSSGMQFGRATFTTTTTEVDIFDGNFALAAGNRFFLDYFTDRPTEGFISALTFNGGSTGGSTPTPPTPTPSPIPLPASSLLLLFGMGGLAGLGVANRRKQAS